MMPLETLVNLSMLGSWVSKLANSCCILTKLFDNPSLVKTLSYGVGIFSSSSIICFSSYIKSWSDNSFSWNFSNSYHITSLYFQIDFFTKCYNVLNKLRTYFSINSIHVCSLYLLPGISYVLNCMKDVVGVLFLLTMLILFPLRMNLFFHNDFTDFVKLGLCNTQLVCIDCFSKWIKIYLIFSFLLSQ